MGRLECLFRYGHAVRRWEDPYTPGADLPYVGRLAWCEACGEEREIESVSRLLEIRRPS
jgi:hypothetical protein